MKQNWKRVVAAATSVLMGAGSLGVAGGVEVQAAMQSEAFNSQVYQGGMDGANGFRNGACSPRTIQLSNQANEADNGKMYCTFECGQLPQALKGNLEGIDPKLAAFPIYESTDGGKTWSKEPVGYVQDSKNGYGMMNSPELYELPVDIGDLKKGTLICGGDSVNIANDYTPTSMDICYSTDLGRSWHYLSTFAEGGKNVMNNTPLWEPFFLYHDGKLIVYYSDETDPAHAQKLVHKTSTDGVHWSEPVNDVALDDYNSRPGMAIVTELDNGQFAMTYEAYGGAWTGMKISNDPEVWDPRDEGGYVGRSASPYITTLDTGAVVSSRSGSTSVFINSRKDAMGDWIEYKLGGVQKNAHNKQLGQLASGNLMVMSGGGFDAGGSAKIIISTFDIDTSGLFKEGQVKLKSADNGLYMSHWGDTWTEGTMAWSWKEVTGGVAGDYGQRFSFDEVEDGYVTIQSAFSGRVVTEENEKIIYDIVKNAEPLENQLWEVVTNDDGTYSYVNKASGKALTMVDNDKQLITTAYTEGETEKAQEFVQEAVDNEKNQPYEVKISCNEGGTVTKQGTFYAPASSDYHLRATPDTGYQIASVKVNGAEKGTNSEIILKPSKDAQGKNISQTVEVTFEKAEEKEYSYISNKEDNNIVVAVWGGSSTAGKQLIEWTNNAGTDEQWNFAENEDGTYAVINNRSGLAMAVRDDGTTVEQATVNSSDEKQKWELVKESETGEYCQIKNVSNGKVLTRSTEEAEAKVYPLLLKEFQNETSGRQLWKLDKATGTYRFSAYTGKGGVISPKERGSVRGGADQTFTLTPDEGYALSDLTVNGTSVMDQVTVAEDGTATYTYKNVQEIFTIIGYFEKKEDKQEYQITVSTTGNGTVTTDKDSAETGEQVLVTVQPQEGNELSEEGLLVTTESGTSVETVLQDDGSYVFTMPAENVTIQGTFVEKAAVPVEKAELQNLYNEYKEKEQGNYTEESWAVFREALAHAKEVLESEDASAEAVEDAIAQLQSAVDSLITVPVDKSRLEQWIQKVEEVLNGEQNFTQASKKAAETALGAAKTVYDDADADKDQVEEAWVNLMNAFLGLDNGTQKSGLAQAIEIAKTILADPETENRYTKESVQNVKDKLEQAETVYETAYDDETQEAIDAAQEEINTATTELVEAVTRLLEKDFGPLQSLVDQAEKILGDAGKYTPSSVKNLQDATDAAKKILEDKTADTETIDAAYSDLLDALAGINLKGNKAELRAALKKAEDILQNSSKYHPGTLEGLKEAYDLAKEVEQDEDAVQSRITEALNNLLKECMEARILGDVDENGTVDTADSAKILRYSAELETFTDEQIMIGDVNGDQVTDSADAERILQFAAEKTANL